MRKETHGKRDIVSARSCPLCGGMTKVIDTRDREDGTTIRKRRCLACSYRFFTEEKIVKNF